jgi:hypothetical protein
MATQRTCRAELDFEEIRKFHGRIRDTLREIETVELSLERLEKWRAIPSGRATPIADRMANLGIRRSLIQYVDGMLASIPR